MLDMGFKPDVDRIVAQTPHERQTLFFSATLEGEVGRIAAGLHDRRRPPRAHAAGAQAGATVEHRFLRVEHEAKVDALVERARRRRARPGARLRAHQARRRPARQAARRRSTSRPSRCTATSRQAQREKALARFEAGHVDTLVATDVAARGIDVDDITHVINFDAPEDRDAYVHRVGRTGRAGRSGTGITFVLDRAGPRHRPDRQRPAPRPAVRGIRPVSYTATPTRRIASARPGRQRAGAGAGGSGQAPLQVDAGGRRRGPHARDQASGPGGGHARGTRAARRLRQRERRVGDPRPPPACGAATWVGAWSADPSDALDLRHRRPDGADAAHREPRGRAGARASQQPPRFGPGDVRRRLDRTASGRGGWARARVAAAADLRRGDDGHPGAGRRRRQRSGRPARATVQRPRGQPVRVRGDRPGDRACRRAADVVLLPAGHGRPRVRRRRYGVRRCRRRPATTSRAWTSRRPLRSGRWSRSATRSPTASAGRRMATTATRTSSRSGCSPPAGDWWRSTPASAATTSSATDRRWTGRPPCTGWPSTCSASRGSAT